MVIVKCPLCLSEHHAVKTWGNRGKTAGTLSLALDGDRVPIALTAGTEPPTCIGQVARLAPKPACTARRRETSLPLPKMKYRFPGPPA
jgi:hypothetical protein